MISVSAFAPLYNTLGRTHIECAMQVCSPNLVGDANFLDQIKRLATRLVKGFCRLPYEDSQCVFWRIGSGPRSLFLFRESGQACEAILSKFCRVLFGAVEESCPFSKRVGKCWNGLPISIATAPSIISFKSQLSSALEELLAEVPWFPILLSPHPNYAIRLCIHV